MWDQLQSIQEAVADLSGFVAPVAIIVGGLVLSLLASWAVVAVVQRTGVDRRLSELLSSDDSKARTSIGRIAARIVFWLGVLITLVAMLSYVDLGEAAEPLQALIVQVLEYAPRILGAALIMVGAYLVARVLRYLIIAALTKTGLDERLSDQLAEVEGREEKVPVSRMLGDTVYWLVFLLFLPAALGALELTGLLEPVTSMFETVVGYLPNLVSAAIILIVGWFVARLVQRILTNLSAAAGVDRLGERLGVGKALGKNRLSDLIGVVAQVLIILPVAIAALEALRLDSITRPASQMLGMILGALPSVFAASLVVVVSFFIGRLVAELVTNLLSSAGFDNILVRLGIAKEVDTSARRAPSNVGGDLVMIAIMLFAFIEATMLLGFERLAGLTYELMELGGRILLGLAIIALGMFLGKAASDVVRRSQIKHHKVLATVARVAVLVLAGAMGLRQMGLANEIIVNAFTLGLGALAVALALAFGLGGRDAASEQLADWRRQLRERDSRDES